MTIQPANQITARHFALFLILLLGLAGLVSVLTGLPGTDESVFLFMGREINSGFIPYRDLWDHKGPPIYVLAWLASFLGGYQMQAGRLFTLLYALSGAVHLARTGMDRPADRKLLLALTCLGLAILASTGGLMTEQLEAGSMMWAVGLAIQAARSENRKTRALKAGLSGIFIGLAMVTRIQGAIYLAPVMAYLFIKQKEGTPRGPQPFLAFCAGLLAPILLTGVWVLLVPGLPGFWNAYIRGNLNYVANESLQAIPRILLDATAPTLGSFVFFFTAGSFALTKFSTARRDVLLLVAVLFASFAEAILTRTGRQPHYWVPALWLLSIGIAWSLDADGPAGTQFSFSHDFGHLLVHLVPFFLLFLQAARPAAARILEPKYLEVAGRISQYAQPGSQIWVAGGTGAELYLYTGTHSATRFFYTGAAARLSIDPDEVIRALSGSEPLIVLGHEWYDGDSITLDAPEPIGDYVSQHYQLAEDIYDASTGWHYGIYKVAHR